MPVLPSTIEIGRPLLFNATTSDINFGLATSQDLAAQTCLAYVYGLGAGEGNNGYIFAKVASASTDDVRFFVAHNSGSPQLTFGSGSGGVASQPNRTAASNSFVYNQWAHVAATWQASLTASTIHLYQGFNGAPLSEPSYAATNDGSGVLRTGIGNNLHVGNRENTDRTWNGTIAYVARWNRILALPELRQAQQYGPLTVPNGLVLCWSGYRDYGPYGLRPSSTTALALGQYPYNRVLGLRYDGKAVFFDMAVAGRTARNTRAQPLGLNVGMGWRMPL